MNELLTPEWKINIINHKLLLCKEQITFIISFWEHYLSHYRTWLETYSILHLECLWYLPRTERLFSPDAWLSFEATFSCISMFHIPITLTRHLVLWVNALIHTPDNSKCFYIPQTIPSVVTYPRQYQVFLHTPDNTKCCYIPQTIPSVVTYPRQYEVLLHTPDNTK